MTTDAEAEPLAQVPEQLDLPAWLNPDGFPHPEALEQIHQEAVATEAHLLATANELIADLQRVHVLVNAVYAAANPATTVVRGENLPWGVLEAVNDATGVTHLRDLTGWLTGTDGEDFIKHDERERLYERLGDFTEWTAELAHEAHRLGCSPDEPTEAS